MRERRREQDIYYENARNTWRRGSERKQTIDEVTRGRSSSDVLKSALKEIAEMDSKFNPAWMPQFLKLYFNPVPLKRLCIFQFVLMLANFVEESIALPKECR